MTYIKFKELEGLQGLPQLPIPEYHRLNEEFIKEVQNTANGIFRKDPENGHPIFGAYTYSPSNEMVTWGILAVGEWLMNQDTDWIAPTYFDFFNEKHQVFLNSPDTTVSEYWYLFYVNLLAGAVYRTLYPHSEQAKECMQKSAQTMKKMAESVDYDFNAQGFLFDDWKDFANRDIYRQPDSIAGYAYQRLFAGQVLDDPAGTKESLEAITRYQAFAENPWYEIPNGSAGVYAAAWLNAHGYSNDVAKTTAWVFDHEAGPMQKGFWGSECVNGLMMGWRGDTRKDAMDSTYSMESLMPMQMLLPALRYCPALALGVNTWVRQVLSAFQLFYGKGVNQLEETKPGEFTAIPYERLQRFDGKEEPVACGDFHGHRSVYGAGYLMWLETLARPTDKEWVFALDLSITDWVAKDTCPVYQIQNPFDTRITVSFTPADIWKKKRPELFGENFRVWDVNTKELLGTFTKEITITLQPEEIKTMVIDREAPTVKNGFICGANGEELMLQEDK